MMDYLNAIIHDEIKKIKAPEVEKNLLYKILSIEQRLLNNKKTQYKKEYRAAVEASL